MTNQSVLRSVRSGALAGGALLAVAGLTPVPSAAQQPVPPEAVQALEYRSIGPAVMGGRVADLAVDEDDASTFYVCTATGGVWKTTNHGSDFTPLFQDQATTSCGDVTLAPSNADVVWVGTGEPQNRQSSPWGNGVYRSVDGGKTWSHLGLENTLHIARIEVHPRDPDVAYVAAVGHLWGPNEERGVYRTTDGGETWEKILYIDEHTGAIDLAMDPKRPGIIYAAMYQRRRTGFGFRGGGPGSGIYRSRDGGDSWEELTNGLPEGDKGRIGLDVWRKDPSVVYAIVEATEGEGVYRSMDGGDSWEMRSDTNPRPMYYSQIRVDPNDMQRVYLGGTSFYVSHDGGRSFESHRWPGVHVDHHAIWVDPSDSDHILIGNDGGVYATFDRTESWRMYDNIVVSQFYEIGINDSDPYMVCGGLQDNGSWCAPNETYGEAGILNAHWKNIYGADGYYTEFVPDEPNLIFAEAQNGRPGRVNLETGESVPVQPVDYPETEGGEPTDLRFNWDTPLLVSHHDPDVVYYGGQFLFRSPDLGQSWERISPDLSKAIDRDTLEIMGKRLEDVQLSRNDGISSYGNMTQISESPHDPDVIYAGMDDGNVQVTRDGGETWTNVVGNVPGLPNRTYVSGLFASRHEPGRVYASFDGHRNDDYEPHVYVSENYGQDWREITSGLPDNSVNRIYEHHRTPELLFASTEVGVWFSIDRGQRWQELGNNLPNVPVDRVLVQERENDLVVGTHGRGIWILDDITPLEMLAEAMADGTYLFPVQAARTINEHDFDGFNAGAWAGENPPRGAMIRYYLGSGSASEGEDAKVSLTVLDGTEEIRSLDGPAGEGMHQVVWDLRYPAPYTEETESPFGGPPDGPKVVPGTYTVRLEAGGETRTTDVTVEADPRARIARADRQARQDAMMSMYAAVKPLHEATEAAEELAGRLEEVREMMGDDEGSADMRARVDSLAQRADSLADELDDWRDDAGDVLGDLDDASSPPTEMQRFTMDRVWSEGMDAVRDFNDFVRTEIADLSSSLGQANVLSPVREPVEVPSRPGGGM